jgi:Mrp family chromosome partitioning ATPase
MLILPAGNSPSNPAELLGSKAMEVLLRDWRQEFDFVLFDTPPVVPVTDAVVLSPKMDAVLLVVRMDRTDRPSMEESCLRLDRAAHRITGLIANDVDFAQQYPGTAGKHSYQKTASRFVERAGRLS